MKRGNTGLDKEWQSFEMRYVFSPWQCMQYGCLSSYSILSHWYLFQRDPIFESVQAFRPNMFIKSDASIPLQTLKAVVPRAFRFPARELWLKTQSKSQERTGDCDS